MGHRRRQHRPPPPLLQPEVTEGTVEIVRLAHGGHGVGLLQGLTVFVPRTAPGDVVDIRLTEYRRRHAFGEVTAIRQASPDRVSPPCSLYEQCGGCHLQHLSYAQQLSIKTTQVRDSLERIGHLPDLPVAPMRGSPQPFAYRNKVLYHYDRNSAALGLVTRQGRSIVDIPQCLISDPRADAVLARLRTFTAVTPWLQQHLHQVQVQVGQRTGAALVTVLVHAALPPWLQQQLWEQLQDLSTGLIMHVKGRETLEVFAGTSSTIAGQSFIHEQVGQQLFRLEPEAFFQVNTVQMERLYALVQDAAALQPSDVVFDLYSGGGVIALLLAAHCAQVYAVESNRQATLLAMQQAAAQGVSNCQFRTGKVERILYRYLAQGIRANVAILDPPRAGCEADVLRTLTLMRVPRLVYVSCSPPTLARDLQMLQELGYQTSLVQPVDMFPQTYHIEAVATLTRRA